MNIEIHTTDDYAEWREQREPEMFLTKDGGTPELAVEVASMTVGLREEFFVQCVAENILPAPYPEGSNEVPINEYIDEVIEAMLTMKYLEYVRSYGWQKNLVLFKALSLPGMTTKED